MVGGLLISLVNTFSAGLALFSRPAIIKISAAIMGMPNMANRKDGLDSMVITSCRKTSSIFFIVTLFGG